MKVVFLGHSKALMTDFDGKRYCFEKRIPIDIPSKVYDEIILSGHTDAQELRPVEEEVTEEQPAPVQPIIKPERPDIKKKIKHKHKKR